MRLLTHHVASRVQTPFRDVQHSNAEEEPGDVGDGDDRRQPIACVIADSSGELGSSRGADSHADYLSARYPMGQ